MNKAQRGPCVAARGKSEMRTGRWRQRRQHAAVAEGWAAAVAALSVGSAMAARAREGRERGRWRRQRCQLRRPRQLWRRRQQAAATKRGGRRSPAIAKARDCRRFATVCESPPVADYPHAAALVSLARLPPLRIRSSTATPTGSTASAADDTATARLYRPAVSTFGQRHLPHPAPVHNYISKRAQGETCPQPPPNARIFKLAPRDYFRSKLTPHTPRLLR